MTDTRQIGPRLDVEEANDFELIVRHLNNGKYKGRLSDEVSNAVTLYMGKVLTENPEWLDDAEDEDQLQRFQSCTDEFQEACASAPLDTEIAEELGQMRQELEVVNTTSMRMLSKILDELEAEGGNQNLPET